MNKILINTKNLLKIIISCLVIFYMLKSCSMAYTFEQFKQFIDACYDNNITSGGMNKNDLEYARNNWYKITNAITQNNIDTTQYTSFAIAGRGSPHISSDNYMQVWFFKSISYCGPADNGNGNTFSIETPYDTTIYIRDTSTEQLKYASQHTWYGNFKCGILSNAPGMTENGFRNCLTQYKWDPNEHPLTPPFDFTQYKITTIDDYNILKFNYIGNTAFGKLGENNYYQLQVRLKDGNLTTLGTALFNENQECYYRDNALIVENNIILANTVYLSYYEPYYLEFTIYSDSTNYEIIGYLYKFYPQNAIIENGQIVSPGSGDYTNQNQTIDIIGGVVGELPSGDSPGSGILGGIASLFIPSSSFFYSYFNNLNTWLTDHLGFLYSPFSIFFDLINRVIAVDFSDPMVEIGPYTLPLNDDIEFIHRYEYHFNDLLLDENVVTIHDIYLIIVDGILILGFLHMLYCKYEEIIGGKKES